MDDINADLGPNPETGDAGVESDRVRPTVRFVRRSRARWPAGLALAMIAVLAASGLAFGAQILPALQSGNPATTQMASQPSTIFAALEEEPTALPTGSSATARPTSP